MKYPDNIGRLLILKLLREQSGFYKRVYFKVYFAIDTCSNFSIQMGIQHDIFDTVIDFGAG